MSILTLIAFVGLSSCSSDQSKLTAAQINQQLTAIKASSEIGVDSNRLESIQNYTDSIKTEPCRFNLKRFTTTKKLPLKASIANSDGVEVWSKYFKDGTLRFNTNDFDRGVYELTFSDRNGIIMTEKFIRN